MTDERGAPQGSNAEQARYWSEDGGPSWVRDEAIYDRMLTPFNEALVGALAPQAGERVLEIGCGFGSTAFAIAARGAAVHGVDISPPMIERARARAEAMGAAATFAVGDAQEDDLGGPYDAVTSRFGVMFFADPVRAFTNIGRATRPGGRLVFVCWRTLDRNPWMSSATEVIRGLMTDPPPPPASGAGPFAFGDAAFVERVLTGAGWRDVALTAFDTEAHMGGDGGIDGAVEQALGSSAVKAMLAAGAPDLRERATEILRVRFAEHVVDGAVRFPAAAWLVAAAR